MARSRRWSGVPQLVTNRYEGGGAHTVVQAGVVRGGIHVHLRAEGARQLRPARRAVLAVALAAFGAQVLLRVAADWPARTAGALLVAGALWQALVALRDARADDEVFVPDDRLDAAAEVLASRLRSVYDREERLARVYDPVPLQVRWAAGDPTLSDHWRGIGGAESEQAPLDGELADVADAFRRLPMRRLVVLGAAGAGKSVLALRLARALLEPSVPAGDARAVHGSSRPVPVVLAPASWDVSACGPWEWAARQLAVQYPQTAAREDERMALARALLESGRVLPVIDGFDEMPEGAQAEALRQLRKSLGPGRGLVLTSRPEAYARAVDAAPVLPGTAIVELLPLTVAQLTEFLPRTTRAVSGQGPSVRTSVPGQVGPSASGRAGGADPATKWDPVLRRMAAAEAVEAAQVAEAARTGKTKPRRRAAGAARRGKDPAARVLCAALSTPLMVGLARAAYSDTRADPAELLEPELFGDRDAVERHLLDAYVPAVYGIALDDRAARGPWDAHDARRWLRFLARQLQRRGSQELAWWRLDLMHRRLVSAIVPGLGLAVLVGALCWSGAGLAVGSAWPRLPLWTVFGTLTAAGLLLWAATQSRTELSGPRRLVFPRGWRPWRPVRTLTAPADIGAASGPWPLHRDDRIASLTTGVPRLVTGEAQPRVMTVALVLVVPLWFAEWWVAGLDWGHPGDFTDRMVFAAAWCLALLAQAWALTPWGRFVVARTYLAATRRLPWRLHAFLEDAHRRGVLRHSGGVYQFRHMELRDRLARHDSGGGGGGGGARDARGARRARSVWGVRGVSGDGDGDGDARARAEPAETDFWFRTVLRIRVRSAAMSLRRSLDHGSLGVAVSLLLTTALFVWSFTALQSIPNAPGPYTSVPEACSLLGRSELRPVMPDPELAAVEPGQCVWIEQGPGRGAILRVIVKVARADRIAGAVSWADSMVRGNGKAGHPALRGVGDRATGMTEPSALDGGGRKATVFARVGNVFTMTTYDEQYADADRAMAVAGALTRRVLHNAGLPVPPGPRLKTAPLTRTAHPAPPPATLTARDRVPLPILEPGEPPGRRSVR
ncbi:NACHT domain-containing protein [Streptomyces lasiicapitis]|uniref:NACHT domain-containing protein n=1 Tax=Streptomyces lasiicapitis TaxID=1923961 RepID=UPI0036C510F0